MVYGSKFGVHLVLEVNQVNFGKIPLITKDWGHYRRGVAKVGPCRNRINTRYIASNSPYSPDMALLSTPLLESGLV